MLHKVNYVYCVTRGLPLHSPERDMSTYNGAYGKVYVTATKAEKTQHFFLDGQASHAAIAECSVFNSLRHPSIVTGETRFEGANVVIDMPSLKKGLAIQPSAMVEIIKGLAYLESAGISHYDLSVDNILFEKNDAPLIIDFGMITFDGVSRINHHFFQKTPEEEKTNHDAKWDVWGLVMCVLCSRDKTLIGDLRKELLAEDRKKILLSRAAKHADKDLLCKMLLPLAERPSFADILTSMNIKVDSYHMAEEDIPAGLITPPSQRGRYNAVALIINMCICYRLRRRTCRMAIGNLNFLMKNLKTGKLPSYAAMCLYLVSQITEKTGLTFQDCTKYCMEEEKILKARAKEVFKRLDMTVFRIAKLDTKEDMEYQLGKPSKKQHNDYFCQCS